MVLRRMISIILLISIIQSCKTDQVKIDNNKTEDRKISTSYQIPTFDQDDRLAKIKNHKQEFQKMIEDHVEEAHIPGVTFGLVVDNELVLTHSTGLADIENEIPASTKIAFRIASMSKSFTAMAILILRDQGKLALHEPVEKYIPAMSKLTYLTNDATPIDIENLLTMTAGFPEDNPWGDRQLDEPDQMLLDLINKGIPFSNIPSFEYEYSNTGYAILGYIISQVSGQSYQEYIREHIFDPLGMENTYWEIDSVPTNELAIGYRWEDGKWKLEPMLHDGSYGAMGGLITTIEDFSKYVCFHLSAWPPRNEDDNGPVKRSTLREMHQAQFGRLYAKAKDWNGEICPQMSGYGYGLGIHQSCDGIKRVRHGGALPGFGSNFVFFPEFGLGLMAFGNLTYTSPYPIQSIKKLIFETLDLKPRILPVSDILKQRKDQVVELIQRWDKELETQILAENFYLDKSRAHRKIEIESMLSQAGPFERIGEIFPQNQLRGTFEIMARNGTIDLFFTLSPEHNPKIQRLDVNFRPSVEQ